uniref:Uncharacterized protein n=1 Tax=Arundo donax TaxID=35708 RepID=A0A0A8Y985_ARUDO
MRSNKICHQHKEESCKSKMVQTAKRIFASIMGVSENAFE